MPYINNEDREPLNEDAKKMKTTGEMNYLFTQAMIDFTLKNNLCYDTINKVTDAFLLCKKYLSKNMIFGFRDKVGFHELVDAWGFNSGKHCGEIEAALVDAWGEYQRRVVGPYEDKKIKENGDVYPQELLRGGTQKKS